MSTTTNIIVLGYTTACLFPVISGADAYINNRFGANISFIVVILLLMIFIPALIKTTILKDGKEFSKIYRNTLGLTIPLLIIGIVSALWGLHPGAYWNEGVRNILVDIHYWVILMLSIGIASSWTLRKHYRLIFIIILIGSCIPFWVDMIYPGTFSQQTERTAGFYGNANDGALSVLYMAIAAINWKKHDFLSLFVLILTGLAVFTTLSVEGIILLSILTGSYIVLNLGGEGMILRKIAFVIITPILAFFLAKPLLVKILDVSTILEQHSSKERLQEIINMSKGDVTFAEDHDRLKLVRDYWLLIQEAPITGHGTAFIDSTLTGPHNMYLKKWVENGLLGLLLYLAMIGFAIRHFMLLRDIRGMIFVGAFIYAGFFDQNVLQNSTLIVLLGISGVLAYLENSEPASLAESRVKLAV